MPDVDEAFFDRHFDGLYRLFASAAGDQANELIQETLLSVGGDREPVCSESACVYRCARLALWRFAERARLELDDDSLLVWFYNGEELTFSELEDVFGCGAPRLRQMLRRRFEIGPPFVLLREPKIPPDDVA
jgi:DNA-directed RNA polymerase specialized sigma24 family protein